MSELELRVAGDAVSPAEGWTLSWLEDRRGLARLSDGTQVVIALAEGSGSDWVVTLHGRRISVSVMTWRERMLAEAETATGRTAEPVSVTATLPGLIVAVAAVAGTEVAEGDALVTIEAMKMQNEVRAPRAGRVTEVHVAAGSRVGAGDPLLRIE